MKKKKKPKKLKAKASITFRDKKIIPKFKPIIVVPDEEECKIGIVE